MILMYVILLLLIGVGLLITKNKFTCPNCGNSKNNKWHDDYRHYDIYCKCDKCEYAWSLFI